MKKVSLNILSVVLLTFWSFCSIAQEIIVPLYGETKGDIPYLEYGRGTDRLGGAKMTNLDTAVFLQVIDSAGATYKVQLAKNHTAYIPKKYLELKDSLVAEPYYLTKSWSVSGDGKHDFIHIGLDARLPYRSFQEINPSRIVVDIFGAVNNTNWITQLKSAKAIKNVYHEQLEDDVFRVIIELKNPHHWGHAISYVKNSLIVRIKHPPSGYRMRDINIAIDAGHGGSAPGASGSTGILEKEYTLIFAKEFEKLLKRKRVPHYMTRTEDVDVDMVNRLKVLQAVDPTLLISFHLNSSSNKAAKGTSTYYKHIGFRPITEAILNRMLELNLKEFGNIGSFNFSLSGPTEYPTCLVEIAFISNEEDEKRILDAKFQKQVAKQVYKGINDWLREVKK